MAANAAVAERELQLRVAGVAKRLEVVRVQVLGGDAVPGHHPHVAILERERAGSAAWRGRASDRMASNAAGRRRRNMAENSEEGRERDTGHEIHLNPGSGGGQWRPDLQTRPPRQWPGQSVRTFSY